MYTVRVLVIHLSLDFRLRQSNRRFTVIKMYSVGFELFAIRGTDKRGRGVISMDIYYIDMSSPIGLSILIGLWKRDRKARVKDLAPPLPGTRRHYRRHTQLGSD